MIKRRKIYWQKPFRIIQFLLIIVLFIFLYPNKLFSQLHKKNLFGKAEYRNMQMMKSLLRLHELRANVAVPGMIFYDEILHKNRVLLSHTDSFCLHQLAVADMLLKDGNTEEAIDMATRLVPIAEQFRSDKVETV